MLYPSIVVQWCVGTVATGALLALGSSAFMLGSLPTRFYNFGFVAVYALGGYFFSLAAAYVPSAWPVAFIIACAGGAVIALLLDEGLYQPTQRRGGGPLVVMLQSLLVTAGTASALEIVAGAAPLPPPPLHLKNVVSSLHVSIQQGVSTIVACIIVLCLTIVLYRLNVGLALRCLALDPPLAAMRQIPVARVRRYAVLAFGMLASASGALECLDIGVTPRMGLPQVISATAIVLIIGEIAIGKIALASLTLGLALTSVSFLTQLDYTNTVAGVALLVGIVVQSVVRRVRR